MMRLQRILFPIFFGLSSSFVRYVKIPLLQKIHMRSLAKLTLLMRAGKSKDNVHEVAREWQRMFPAPKLIPITGNDTNTAYAEIRMQCPLRGTGDLNACYHLMEYDRELLRKIGGELVVMESQASPNKDYCSVAIRMKGANIADLKSAYQQSR